MAIRKAPHIGLARVDIAKYHILSGLNSILIFSRLQRLEVRDGGVGRVGFSRGLSLVGVFSPCSHGHPSVCVCVLITFPSKDTHP